MGMVDYIELFIFAKCSLWFKLLALLSDPNFLSSYKLWNELGHISLVPNYSSDITYVENAGRVITAGFHMTAKMSL